jgi:hypothetical protein
VSLGTANVNGPLVASTAALVKEHAANASALGIWTTAWPLEKSNRTESSVPATSCVELGWTCHFTE